MVAPDVSPGLKWCRRCETTKPVTDFAGNKSAKDGLQGSCRGCCAAAYRDRRTVAGFLVRPAAIPEGHKHCRSCDTVKPWSDWSRNVSASDGFQTRCRDCAAAASRRDHLSRSYGMSSEDLAHRLSDQNGLCIICLRAPAVHVDHDHATGEVRGMLCFPCNVAIGHLDDDPSRLRRAADYLDGRKILLRATHPGVVEITYPEPQQPSIPPQRPGPSRPPVDIGARRAMAARG